jgi:hypothetical protein
VSQWNEPFTDTFVMRWRDSSWGNFTSSKSFHFQIADSHNSTLPFLYVSGIWASRISQSCIVKALTFQSLGQIL